MRIGRLLIEIELPRLDVSMRMPRVHIDVREAQADIGLKPIGKIARELAARGHRAAWQAISQIAREGDQLARIEEGENPIADQARRRGLRDLQINIDVAPKHPVLVEVEPGEAAVQVTPGQVRVRASVLLASGQYIDIEA
ncbi:MAG: hypothetical protein BAA04_03410 [Firmicutes bacterium ZCTH02-B6]|nr:MAG: hypothetical protein BAA04_03410 [Firmicutes bacterium ZCTH02-B6]